VFNTLISPEELKLALAGRDLVIVDCRFDLQNPGWGKQVYEQGHIPCALHVDLETDLSDVSAKGGGRHPLPSPERLAVTFSNLGIGAGVQVVAYDDNGGGFAARLWWILQYLGHQEAAVLDGGYPAWLKGGYELETGPSPRTHRAFTPRVQENMLVTVGEVEELLGSRDAMIIDSRAPERFAGLEEPYDPVAGHIPGAVNRNWMDNLDPEGRLLAPGTLLASFMGILRDHPPQDSVIYCGSGVTACHNILAMRAAGLPFPRLYAGSWSEWCCDPDRPYEPARHNPPAAPLN
jgi:thiosulfate/3-mercaptopyruvate sulfurtransferase